ncbi:hypothetical protein [Bacillus mycoides]|uniref:hypothetical protein n=1 Tax=Bacillus mycoides TaxID=1405 RepID=UPI003D2340D0
MGVTLEELEKCFNEAVNEGAEYVAVQIEMDGFPSDEVIINDKHNIDSLLRFLWTHLWMQNLMIYFVKNYIVS